MRIDPDVILDLQRILERDRVGVWQRWVPFAFPGLTVAHVDEREPRGLVRMIDLGKARLWSIQATSQTVTGDPGTLPSAEATIAILLQEEGVVQVCQGGRRAQIVSGDATVIDASGPFSIENIGMARTLVCVIPNVFVTARFPSLLDHAARRISHDAPLCQYTRALVDEVIQSHRQLSSPERSAALAAILGLLAAVPRSSDSEHAPPHWRIRKALEEIDSAIEDADLNAVLVARRQNISRRRLDQLFASEIGSTLAAQILERRLMHAATALCDPAQAISQITEIAFASGFKDSAHFSRAFRKKFGMSPRHWRKTALEEPKD